ncbi:MAG: aminopeptidase P N-terminal domain-containing protein [Pseudomonadota bacterium]
MSGLPAIEFKQRRQRMLGMMSPGSIAIIPGAGLQRRNRDIQYQFRQDSDLYYLTGFVEPTALLVLLPGREHGETILFCAERDPVAERWDGERMGPERAAQMLGVDDAFPYGDMGDILPGLLEGRSRIYMTMGEYVDIDNLMVGWLGELRKREPGGLVIPGEIVALKNYLHELRLYKSKREQKLMKRAASITCEAHKRAMRQCAPGMTEHQLDAELTYEFMRHGARCAAYPSIIGSGANACVMHYVENNATIEKGDLVLIDAGCEYEHYAADVTRTFPATGKFTKPQKDIYAIVLQANRDAIGACRPGEHFNAPHEAAVRALVRGLVKLGLLEGCVCNYPRLPTRIRK